MERGIALWKSLRSLRRMGLMVESLQNGPIELEELHVPIPGLPQDLIGLRLALVSDLHIGAAYPREPELLALLQSTRPDLICILGDMIDSSTPSLAPLEPLLIAMSALAPTIAVLGNNDYIRRSLAALRTLYRQSGVILLEDESRVLPRGGSALRLIGVQDPMGFSRRLHVERSPDGPDSEPLGTLLARPMTTVLLIHQAQRAVAYRNQGIDLALGGHAHGGQFRFPGFGPVYAPGQGLRPSYTSGLYPLPGLRLVVSRGLGNHGFPIRIRNRPHLPLVVLGPE